jgi:peptidyl-dipeptidase Dcp
MTNPLLAPWTGPYGLPPFADIRAEHFPAAFSAAMRDHLGEIDALAASSEAPTFANTVAAFDRAGRLL